MASMRTTTGGTTSTLTHGTKTTTVAVDDETETRCLQKFTEAIPGSLTPLLPADLPKLRWKGVDPFARALWTQYPDSIALFRSAQMDAYVDEALTHKVAAALVDVAVERASVNGAELLPRGLEAWVARVRALDGAQQEIGRLLALFRGGRM